jgi:hypothetical protein
MTLTRASPGFDPALDSPDPGKKAPDQAYSDLLLDFPLASGPETMVSREIGYVMQTDERFKVSLPQLTRFPDVKAMGSVNRDLAKELDKTRLGAAFCLQGVDFRGGEWDEKLQVAASDVVLSIVRETSYFCGGPHPDAATEPLVYDMRTGRTLDLKDLFRVQASSAILRDGIVPPGPTHALMLRLYRQHSPKSHEGCDKSVITGGITIKMYFDQSGLVIVPELAYASRVCGPKTRIPYEELRPFFIAASMPFSGNHLQYPTKFTIVPFTVLPRGALRAKAIGKLQ